MELSIPDFVSAVKEFSMVFFFHMLYNIYIIVSRKNGKKLKPKQRSTS